FHAGAARQVLDRIEELHAVVLHQEVDRAAMRAAAEAVVELLDRRNRERGRAFVVERAARRELAALLLQRDARTDQLDDVGPREQVIDEGVGDAGHGRVRMPRRAGPGWRARSAWRVPVRRSPRSPARR